MPGTTPEGRVKKKINRVLDKYDSRIYYFMPVPNGYGKATIDYLCFFRGRGFAIEAKAFGEVPRSRQEGIISDIQASGAKVFVIDGDTTELELWLDAVEDDEA